MTTAEFIRRAHNPFERLFDTLINPARRERAMILLLAGYAAVWTLYGVIAKGSQDIHFDMGEMIAWSHEILLGTPKHPPLAAWLVGAWFSVMPAQAWAYYLFAVILATAALWIAWCIAARYLSADKRIIGIALLTFVPFYNFHALKFNANTVLIPFWAATTWWFLRSFETRRVGWSVLTGIGAAACMLGKYWSIVLLAGLGVAALTDSRRRLYFRSPAPWLTIVVGAILVAPHAVWVIMHHFEPVTYAIAAHPATHAAAARSAIIFMVGVLGYIAVPILFGLLAAQPTVAAIRDTIWPAEPERRTIIIAFVIPILFGALTAVAFTVRISPLWTMSAMSLLPIVLLSSPLVVITRNAAVRLLAMAIVFPLIMIAASPVIAIVIHREGVPNYATHYRLIARAVERAWHERTNEPLRIIGSYSGIVNGIVFYFDDAPSTLDIITPAQTPWVDEDRIRREGIALVCPVPETFCVQALNAYVARYPDAKVKDVGLARRYLGTLDTKVNYRIAIIPPQIQ
jgi:4-amino-4-deoxy-L-arabinose transferase-like glycosyltransferase